MTISVSVKSVLLRGTAVRWQWHRRRETKISCELPQLMERAEGNQCVPSGAQGVT